VLACWACAAIGCGGTLDAGVDVPHGLLPVDERHPVILNNDGPNDNWQGEYALLLASAQRLELAAIVINTGGSWSNLDANMAGWNNLVAAARASGMHNVPDPLASAGPSLTRPENGDIDATTPNGSSGARLIVEASRRLAKPYRPVVVATGGRLTDVADAYLLDHTLPDRVVIVSSLGTINGNGARMGIPNGEMDAWADTIVVNRFRYVQVSAYYDQTADVPSNRVAALPANPFGAWMASKQSSILELDVAADQVSIAAVALRGFVLDVARLAQSGTEPTSSGPRPLLEPAAEGKAWLVTHSDGSAMAATLWQLLDDPAVFGG
jgi:hypothetical protein